MLVFLYVLLPEIVFLQILGRFLCVWGAGDVGGLRSSKAPVFRKDEVVAVAAAVCARGGSKRAAVRGALTRIDHGLSWEGAAAAAAAAGVPAAAGAPLLTAVALAQPAASRPTQCCRVHALSQQSAIGRSFAPEVN